MYILQHCGLKSFKDLGLFGDMICVYSFNGKTQVMGCFLNSAIDHLLQCQGSQ